MIHMEYYLVVSTIMMFAERHGHQLRRVQPFSLSGRHGRLFLCTLFHRHFGCGNGYSYRHHD